jgi:hypothetical protein
MLDDDLKFFYEIVDRKTVKIDPHAALEKAEALIKYIPNLAQASLDYTQFAWSASKEIKLNSYCDCCVYINTKLASAAKYRSEIELKEDRDFSMQLLAAGFNTARISKYAFHSPKNGSNNGGLKKLYDIPGKEEEVCHKVVNIWGEKFCTVQKKKNGRTDLKINWKGLLAYGQQNRLMHNQILH